MTLPTFMGTIASSKIPAPPSYSQWRFVLSSSYSAGQFSLFEGEMRETVGGSDVATSGNTIFANQFSGSFPASAVWDDNISTRMVALSADLAGRRKVWTGQNFGTLKTIREISLYAATSFVNEMPLEWSVEVDDAGTWKKFIEFQNNPGWSATETRVFKLPELLRPDVPYMTGIPYGDILSVSTSSFATKGGVHTPAVDIVISGVHVSVTTAGSHEIVIAAVTENGTVWDVDTILARKSYTAINGLNIVELDSPITVTAGTDIAILDTYSGAASDTTSSGLNFPDRQGKMSNPLLAEFATSPGFRMTSRNVTAGSSSTDRSSSPWGLYPQCRAASAFTGLNAVSERYWRFNNIDASGSTTLRAAQMRLLDSNLFSIPVDSITLSPSVANSFRLVDGAPCFRDISFGTTNAATITFDFGSAVTPAFVQVGAEFSNSNPTDWVLQSSPDNSTWTTRLTVTADAVGTGRDIRYYQI